MLVNHYFGNGEVIVGIEQQLDDDRWAVCLAPSNAEPGNPYSPGDTVEHSDDIEYDVCLVFPTYSQAVSVGMALLNAFTFEG